MIEDSTFLKYEHLQNSSISFFNVTTPKSFISPNSHLILGLSHFLRHEYYSFNVVIITIFPPSFRYFIEWSTICLMHGMTAQQSENSIVLYFLWVSYLKISWQLAYTCSERPKRLIFSCAILMECILMSNPSIVRFLSLTYWALPKSAIAFPMPISRTSDPLFSYFKYSLYSWVVYGVTMFW